MKPKFSWLLPVKDEAQSLKQLIDEISFVMKGESFEVIIIDDGSRDGSLKTLNMLNKSKKFLKVFHFQDTKGKWNALKFAFSKSLGEVIITLDADLQDDPLEAVILLTIFKQGRYDLVSGWRFKREDPLLKVLISTFGNKFISFLNSKKFHDLNSPLKIYRRKVFNSLPKSGSLLRFSLLFAYKMGYRVIETKITHHPRLYGKSKFGLIKNLRIIYDLVLITLLFNGSNSLEKPFNIKRSNKVDKYK